MADSVVDEKLMRFCTRFLRILTFFTLLLSCSCQTETKSALFVQIEELAKQGNPDAQYHLGMMYNNAEGVAQDSTKAFEWFQKAADSGNPLAAFKLGCYFGGQFPGVVSIDQTKYFEYSLVAANAGYSLAQSEVGNLYVQQGNADEALKWWKLAAKQGHPQALYNLSVVYNEGEIIPKDKVLTYSYFKLAKLTSEKEITPAANEGLNEIARNMTRDELKKAEQIVSEWESHPTSITQKAMNGIEEAEKLVKNSGNPTK